MIVVSANLPIYDIEQIRQIPPPSGSYLPVEPRAAQSPFSVLRAPHATDIAVLQHILAETERTDGHKKTPPNSFRYTVVSTKSLRTNVTVFNFMIN
jgi:hypothetical protein